MDKPVIGFIGTGVMGKSMAGNLMRGGYRLNVYTRTKSKADALIARGATWRESVAELAAASEIIITIVGFPNDVEEVYLGEDGAVNHAKPGTILVDMTTSSPLLAQRIAEAASAKGLTALDAPVSGGDVGAQKGKLSIMVGGDAAAFEQLQPIFELMGENIVLQGGPGAGQHTKMCNQIAIASNMIGVCEAMAYARRSGLDPETVLKSISSGAAGSWSLSNLAPRMLADNFAPGFFVKHFIKDMRIAIESADAMGLNLPGLKLAKQLYDDLAARGCENDGTQALFKLYAEKPAPA